MAKILVVEDDQVCACLIEDLLTELGHTVEVVHDGKEGLDRLKIYDYAMAVLDWELPKRSGIEVLSEFRQRGGKIPILMLTGKGTSVEKAEGLETGADDYLAKPFDGRELAARIRALLRRPAEYVKERLVVGDIELYSASRKVTRSGIEIPLLPKEFNLLEFLMRNCNQVFTLEELLNNVWDSESDSSPDAIRKVVERLRKKVDAQDGTSLIETVHRVGYVVRTNNSD